MTTTSYYSPVRDEEGGGGGEKHGLGPIVMGFQDAFRSDLDTTRYVDVATSKRLDEEDAKDVRDLDRATRGWFGFASFLGMDGTAILIGLCAAWAVHQTIYLHLSWTDNGNYGLYQLWARAPTQHFNLGFSFAWPFFVIWIMCGILWLHTTLHTGKMMASGTTMSFLNFGLIDWFLKQVASLRVSEMALMNLHPVRHLTNGLFFSGLSLASFLMMGFTDAIQLAFTALFIFGGFSSIALPELMINGYKRKGVIGSYNRYTMIAWLFYFMCAVYVLLPFLYLFSLWPWFITQAPMLYWGIFVPFFFGVLWILAWFTPNLLRAKHVVPTMMGMVGHYMFLIVIGTIVVGCALSLWLSGTWSLATTIPEILALGKVIFSG